MSIAEQQKFLTNFDKKLQRKVAAYRRARANRQSHQFIVTRRALHKGVEDTIERNLAGMEGLGALKKNMHIALDPKITVLMQEIKTRVRSRIEGDSVVVGRVTKDTKDEFEAWFSASVMDNGNYRNIYKQVYTSYNKLLDQFAQDVADISQAVIGMSFGDKAKNYFNLEHDLYQGISESLTRDSLVEALQDISGIEYEEVLTWLKNSEIDVNIIRDTTTDTMKVFIGSKYGNLADAFATKTRSAQLKELIAGAKKQVLEDGEKILGLPGSPSFVDMKRKKLLEKVTNEFKKVDGVKITLDENIKVKGKRDSINLDKTERSGGVQKKSGLKKKNATKPQTRRRDPYANKRVQKGVAATPLQLIGLINKKLPDVIRDRMVPPRLQYQTGRFASSVKVVDVSETRQGFASLGYTYMHDPYKVYESTSGTRYSDIERDPRPLIDQSIRHIAQQMALGRFYTRRV